MSKKKHTKKTSLDKAKSMLAGIGEEEAMSECRKELKHVKAAFDEVYWRAVMYHIKLLTNKNK